VYVLNVCFNIHVVAVLSTVLSVFTPAEIAMHGQLVILLICRPGIMNIAM